MTFRLLYIPIEERNIDSITSKLRTVQSKPSKTTSKMALSRKSLAGPGYIILNGIRAMNIIGLLAVIAGSVVMLVKTSVSSKFFFFDAVSHILTAITSSKSSENARNVDRYDANKKLTVFLLASEMSLFRGYYARNWPLLSPTHGFVSLALAMVVLGINMLGNLNKPATNKKSLGLPFWRIVIGSGIVIFILGWVNLVASYVFRDRAQNITARQVRAHGAVAALKTPRTSNGTPPAPEFAQTYMSNATTPTKSSNPFRILTTERRNSTLPSYHESSPRSVSSPPYPARDPVSPTSRYSRATACTKKKVFGILGRNRDSLAPPLPINVQDRPMEISSPMGVNPQFAHLVQRPDSALHPSRTGESEAFRWRAAS